MAMINGPTCWRAMESGGDPGHSGEEMPYIMGAALTAFKHLIHRCLVEMQALNLLNFQEKLEPGFFFSPLKCCLDFTKCAG